MSAAQGSSRLQQVAEGDRESWPLIGPDRRPVEPVDRYLAWLTHVEKSPNTVRAYARDLKLFVTFLAARDLAWDGVSSETLGEFTAGCGVQRCARSRIRERATRRFHHARAEELSAPRDTSQLLPLRAISIDADAWPTAPVLRGDAEVG